MEHFWRLMCCSSGQLRDDDNSLLVSDGSAHESSSIEQLPSLHQTYTAEANEGATQQIIDTISQLPDSSLESIQSTLATCMDFIPTHHVRMHILSHLIDTLPKTNKMATLRLLASTLDEKQRSEMGAMIAGLPASVFGDAAGLRERETTRVLVDLLADTKECLHIDRIRLASQKKFADSTLEMFQHALSSLPVSDHEKIIMGVLQLQLPALKMKITLKQLIFSRCLQSDTTSRSDFVQQLLS